MTGMTFNTTSPTHRPRRAARTAAAVALAGLVLVATACSSSDDVASPADDRRTDQIPRRQRALLHRPRQ
jgi:hypothetical protein